MRPVEVHQNHHHFRHHLAPDRNEKLDVGLVGQRFNIGRFKEINADTITALVLSIGSFTAADLVVTNSTTLSYLSPGLVLYTGTGGLIKAESGFEYNETTNLFTVSNAVVGGGTQQGTFPLTVNTTAADEFFALKDTTVTFVAKRESIAGMGSSEMLSIAPTTNDDLKLYLASVTGGMRMYLWDDAVTLPNIVSTGLKPTFAVTGDILVGDIDAYGSNPMTHFRRPATGLVASAVTQFFSAKNGVNDTDGGAQFVMAPSTGGSDNDGYIELVAYGQGSGSLANAILFTTRSGAGAVTRRWQITSAGVLLPFADNTYDIGTTANRVRRVNVNEGIVFPATQVPSSDANTLDDYEEGTWTPVLTFATPGNLSVAYTAQSGSYTKIGRQVFLTCNLITSSFTHTTASGNLQVTGLPFTSSGSFSFVGVLEWGGITKANYTQVNCAVGAAATTMTFTASGSGQSVSSVTTADCPTGGTMRLNFTFMYHV